MKQIVLFLLIVGIVLVLMGYLEIYFDSQKNKKVVEYRFIPRDVYDQLEGDNLNEQFNFMFNSSDIRYNTNLV